MYAVGKYRARVTAQALAPSKSKQTPQFVLTFQPIGMYDPSKPDGELAHCDAYERSIFRAITKGTIDFVMEDLEALGFQGTSFSELDPNNGNHHSFVDQEIDVYCKHEEYQGKQQERWNISRGGGLQLEPMAKKDLATLDSLFGKKLKERNGGKKAAPAKTEPATQTAAAGDDEIPF